MWCESKEKTELEGGQPSRQRAQVDVPLSAILACLLVEKCREDAGMDLLANVASLACGMRVKLSFSTPGAESHGGLSLSCAASVVLSVQRCSAWASIDLMLI